MRTTRVDITRTEQKHNTLNPFILKQSDLIKKPVFVNAQYFMKGKCDYIC